MGLAISTGHLADLVANDAEGAEWFRKRLAALNEVLVENELSPHVETEVAGHARSHVSSFPYSFLHYVRRAYAKVKNGHALTSVTEGEDPSQDDDVADVACDMDHHLLCHADSEGFYIPIDFTEVIFDDDRLPGAMLCSSQKLMRELLFIAPALAAVQDGGPYFRELIVWLTLFENARVSIANRSLIVFH